MKKFSLFIAFFLSLGALMAQVPKGINYQTVIRDANLDPMANQAVSFLISFTDGGINVYYAETHQVVTDQLGMAHLVLGNGTPIGGTFDGIDWSLVREASIDLDPDGGSNFTNLGSLPLQSVPYALLAEDVLNKDDADADPANELQALLFDPATGELTLTEGNSVFVFDPSNLDKDTTNELQLLGMNPATGELSISNGNTVNVFNPNDNDQDNTNELQMLQYDSASATLTISNGNQVVLPTIVAPDADADPTNELQQLDFDNMTGVLSISDGNQVVIPGAAPDPDEDPTNELQNLFFDAGTGDLSISDGNTVNVLDPNDLDKDPTNEIQMLVIDTMAGTLTISGGNTVQLPAGGGGGGASPWVQNMGDIYYDAGNVGIGRQSASESLEVEGTVWAGSSQGASTMNVNGFSLKDAGATTNAYLGTKTLGGGGYTGLAAQNKPWLYLRESINDSCCLQSVLGIAGDGTGLLELYGSTANKPNIFLGSALGCSDCGSLELWNDGGSPAVISGSASGSGGYLLTYGPTGGFNTELSFLPGDPEHGALLVANETGQVTGIFASTSAGGLFQIADKVGTGKMAGLVNASDAASIRGLGGAGSFNFVLDNSIDNADWGFIGALNENSQEASVMTVTGGGEGAIFTLGANGNLNAGLLSINNDPDAGFVGVFDATGTAKAGMYVDAMGQGVIFGDVKNFRVAHPNDPNAEIWYASLEGPEVAAYTRGTETLENGQRFVAYPDYFGSVIDPTTVTVVLTPHEWDTYGLAVVEKNANGFVVRELKGGTGNFSFDWEVKAVRKGHEQFEVVRPKLQIEVNAMPFSASSAKGEGSTGMVPMPAKK